MNLRITNGFDRLSDPNLLVKAQDVLQAMTSNVHYPDPSPPLSALQAKITEYSNALSAAADGSKVQKLIRDEKRQELISLLHALSKYVLFSASSQAVAASSGFTVAKEPQPAPPMSPPHNPSFANGSNSGELIAATNKVPGARAYLFQYTLDPLSGSSVWQAQVGSTRETVLRNLPVGQRIWCKVTAVGAHNQVLCSEASLSKVVQ
ncbi:MAG: hypothetical protein ICV79_08785 [Flavisolibacter sp.]|nr:hypothetical protein [Flavisolibacter sp.]